MKVQATHSADHTARKNLQSCVSSLFSSRVKCQFTLLIAYICNTAKSCNKIQRSRNTGESVSRIGFKRETGEMTWNTGAPVKIREIWQPYLKRQNEMTGQLGRIDIYWHFICIGDLILATFSIINVKYLPCTPLHGQLMDTPCIAPPRVTQKIFAFLVDWYNHIVLTMSIKLVSFLHLYFLHRGLSDRLSITI